MFKNRGFSAVVLVIILAVLIGGGYAVWQKQLGSEASKSELSTLGVDTTGWKIYRNEEYGFEIKYPPNKTVSLEPYIRPMGTDLGLGSFKEGSVTTETILVIQNDDYITGVTRIFIFDGNVTNLENAVSQRRDLIGLPYTVSKIDIGSIVGYEVTTQGTTASPMEVYFQDSKHSYLARPDQNAIAEFKEILSTFRFINNTLSTLGVDTTNWKTYRNDKYGFEFKYPVERTAFTFDKGNKIPNADRSKLIPAPPDSDEVHIALDAKNETLALCCEPILLTFYINATTMTPRKWIEKYIDIPEWQSGPIIVKDITFAGKPAIEVNSQYTGYNGPGHVIAVRLNESSMLIIRDVDSFPSPEFFSTFPEILSTFRFIK